MSTSGNDPLAGLPEAANFAVSSTTLADSAAMSLEQMSGIAGVPGGKDISPQLSWSGAPEGTTMAFHTLGRAVLIATAAIPG
jgi:phosphatidylethanolamine-binding protein (PEBP) family uncharacterized protein